jgi:hypothetical protein
MGGAHALLGREIAEHLVRLVVGPTHLGAPSISGDSIIVRLERSVDLVTRLLRII